MNNDPRELYNRPPSGDPLFDYKPTRWERFWLRIGYALESFLTAGLVCPKCGRDRVPWRDNKWACRSCDLQ